MPRSSDTRVIRRLGRPFFVLALIVATEAELQAAHPISWTDAWVTVDDIVEVKLNIFLDDVLRHAGVPISDTNRVPAAEVQRAIELHSKQLNRLLRIYDQDGIRLENPEVTGPRWRPPADEVDLQADASLKLSWKLSFQIEQHSDSYTFIHGFTSDNLTQPGELRLHLRYVPAKKRIDAVIQPFRPHKVVLPTPGRSPAVEPNGVTLRCTVAPQRLMLEVSLPLLLADNVFPQARQYRSDGRQLPEQLSPEAAERILSAARTWGTQFTMLQGSSQLELLDAHSEWLIDESSPTDQPLAAGQSVPVFGTSIGIRALFVSRTQPDAPIVRLNGLPDQIAELTLETVTPQSQSSQVVEVSLEDEIQTREIQLPRMTALPAGAFESAEAHNFRPVTFIESRLSFELFASMVLTAAVICVVILRCTLQNILKILSCAIVTGVCVAIGMLLPVEEERLDRDEVAALAGSRIDSVYSVIWDSSEDEMLDRLEPFVSDDMAAAIYLPLQESLVSDAESPLLVDIDDVSVEAVRVESFARDRIATRVEWTVCGPVTHWGHTHVRQQRIVAECDFVPDRGRWKLATLEVVSQEYSLADESDQ